MRVESQLLSTMKKFVPWLLSSSSKKLIERAAPEGLAMSDTDILRSER